MSKILTVPSIQCRADEIGSRVYDVEIKEEIFSVRAHSLEDAKEFASRTEKDREVKNIQEELKSMEQEISHMCNRLRELGESPY